MEDSPYKNYIKDETELPEEQTIQLVIFKILEHKFAVPISQIREIVNTLPITPIPDSPEYIRGLANLHGEISLVVDLGLRLNILDQIHTNSKHIVVIHKEADKERKKEMFGMLVDEVTQILRVPKSSIRNKPSVKQQHRGDYISAVWSDSNDNLIIILNLDLILSDEALTQLDKSKVEKTFQVYNDSSLREVADKSRGE